MSWSAFNAGIVICYNGWRACGIYALESACLGGETDWWLYAMPCECIHKILFFVCMHMFNSGAYPGFTVEGFLAVACISRVKILANTPTFRPRPVINDCCFYQRWQPFAWFSTILAGKHKDKHKRRRSRLVSSDFSTCTLNLETMGVSSSWIILRIILNLTAKGGFRATR